MKYPGDLFSDVELLKSLADHSDEISFDRFHAQDLQIETKPDATPVTDADRAVEKKIREHLLKERPLDKIVGEEFGSPDEIKSGERYWVIDPIDGTKNFLRGVPIWATLIQISVSNVKNLSDASLSFSDLVGWGERRDLYLAFMERAWRVRGIGDFWSHMLVAEGAVDIAAEPSLALWDMAAVAIVVKEAGGRFSDLENNDGPFGKSGVSTNGHLHEIFIKAINS